MTPRTRQDQAHEDTPDPSQSALLEIITRQNDMINRLSKRLEQMESSGQQSSQDLEVDQFRKEVKAKLGEPKVIL
jgi:small-conductance mechanosensitive channel